MPAHTLRCPLHNFHKHSLYLQSLPEHNIPGRDSHKAKVGGGQSSEAREAREPLADPTSTTMEERRAVVGQPGSRFRRPQEAVGGFTPATNVLMWWRFWVTPWPILHLQLAWFVDDEGSFYCSHWISIVDAEGYSFGYSHEGIPVSWCLKILQLLDQEWVKSY